MLDYSSSCSAGRRYLAGARDEEFLYWDRGDEVQKQVAEVAKALDQRSDELAVLTCPRGHRSLVVVAADSAVGADAPPQIVCTLSSGDVYSA